MSPVDPRTGDRLNKNVFTAQSKSGVPSGATVVDSTVPTAMRGVPASLVDAEDNVFVAVFGDAGVPADKFVFRVDSAGLHDVVCLIGGQADGPTIACVPEHVVCV